MNVVRVSSRRGELSRRAIEDNTTVLQLVKDAITQTGSIHGAALRLGVNPNTVRYHLKRAGLAIKSQISVELEVTGEPQ